MTKEIDNPKEMQRVKFVNLWGDKTLKQLQKEVDSYHSYFSRCNGHYEWHGKGGSNPQDLTESDRFNLLREMLIEKQKISDIKC